MSVCAGHWAVWPPGQSGHNCLPHCRTTPDNTRPDVSPGLSGLSHHSPHWPWRPFCPLWPPWPLRPYCPHRPQYFKYITGLISKASQESLASLTLRVPITSLGHTGLFHKTIYLYIYYICYILIFLKIYDDPAGSIHVVTHIYNVCIFVTSTGQMRL